jgi:hypothetical protein
MDMRPDQPPEGKLIAEAAERMDISIREAARRAGLSYGRWRQIAQGYQNVSPGEFAKVRAPARTLAKMALVTGVSPEQMEAAGRPDAAAVMRETPRLPAPPDPGRHRAPLTADADAAAVEAYRVVVDAEREAGLPPRDDQEARIFAATILSEDEKRALAAELRWILAGGAEELRRRRA